MTLIKKPFELSVQTTIKALIYGQPGLGKTTLGLSAPSPLLLDFDGGVHRVQPMHQCDTVQIAQWEDVLAVLNEDLRPYQTLVLDTAGKMLDYMGAYLIKMNPKLGKSNGALTLQGYGERKAEFNAFLKRVTLMGKNLVFIAHDKEEKEGDTKIIRPEIGGSSGGDLVKELDLVGYMEAIGKKRTISFDPCEKFYGKNTCQLPALMELSELKEGVSNNMLTEIFTSYHKALEVRKKVAVEYNELMDVIREKVESIKDAETANDVIDFVTKFESHIWDSKLQASYMIMKVAKELGLVMNKSKRYENSSPVTIENLSLKDAIEPSEETPEPELVDETIGNDVKEIVNGKKAAKLF